MAQTSYSSIGANQTGLQYRTQDNDRYAAALTNHSGSSRPSYAVAGSLWLDTSGTPWTMYLFDGTDDIALGTFNATTNLFAVANGLSSSSTIAMTAAFNEAAATVASATTTDIGAAAGNYVSVTGTTTITGLGTVQAGTRRIVRFAGALILTHNATSLILPGGTNITTVAGDVATFVSLGSGNWVCVDYSGKVLATLENLPIVAGDLIYGSATDTINRLAAGVNGQVLTLASGLPSWATPAAGGGALTKITTTDASAASTIDFTSGIDSTYNYYMFVMEGVTVSGANADLRVQLSTDAGSTWTVSLSRAGMNEYNSSLSASHSTGVTTGLIIAEGPLLSAGTDSNGNFSGVLYLFRPSASSGHKIMNWHIGYSAPTGDVGVNVGSGVAATIGTAINAIRFKPGNATTFTGRFILYGVS